MLQGPNSKFANHSKKFRIFSVQSGLRGSNDSVGGKNGDLSIVFLVGSGKGLISTSVDWIELAQDRDR